MARTLVAYATADWHVPERHGAGAWASIPEISGDALYALEQVVALCVRDRVPLLAAGDLLDGPDPDPETLATLYKILRPVDDAGAELYYVLGNHDRNRDWLAPLGRMAVRLDDRQQGKSGPSGQPGTGKPTGKFGPIGNSGSAGRKQKPRELKNGCRLVGVSYQATPEDLKRVVDELPTAEIGLYHQQWIEFTSSYGGTGKFTLADLPQHGVAICGDVHVQKEWASANHRGPRRGVSPGALVPQSIVEFVPSTACAVYDDGSIERIPLAGRQYVTYTVTSVDDANAAVNNAARLAPDYALPQSISAPFLVVRIAEHIPGFVELLDSVTRQSGCILRTYDTTGSTAPQHDAAQGVTAPQQPPTPYRGLAAVIEEWDAPGPARRLAAALVAPNTDFREVIRESRAAHAIAATRRE